MNKKSVIILLSVLVLLSLGVLYVWGTIAEDLTGLTITHTFDYDDTYGVTNWTKGNSTVTMNLTIAMGTGASMAVGAINVTEVYFDTPPNVRLDDFQNVSNSSGTILFTGETVVSSGWDCSASNGTHGTTTYLNWSCTNDTGTSLLGADTSFNFAFNFTANHSDADSSIVDEELVEWNITVATDNESSTTMYNTNIDNQNPRIISVNITDGNTTYTNESTWGNADNMMLSGYGTWVVTAEIEDSNLDSANNKGIWIAYSCNSTNASFTSEGAGGGAEYEAEMVVTHTNTVAGFDEKARATASINPACFRTDVRAANETFSFVFLTNDSFNHRVILNHTGINGISNDQDISFGIPYDDAEILPSIFSVNVTQATATGLGDGSGVTKTLDMASLDGTDDFLRGAQELTFEVEVRGEQKNTLTAHVAWNDTGAATLTNVVNSSIHRAQFGSAARASLVTDWLNLTNQSTSIAVNDTSVLYNGTLTISANNSDWAFWVYIFNGDAISTGAEGDATVNYTTVAGPFRFTADSTAPVLTMTPPTDRTINPKGSITYTCKGTDAGSSVNKIMWELKKPSGDWVEKQAYESVDSAGADTITFTGDDTNAAGTYEVRCKSIDNVGNEGTHLSSNAETFSVHYSTGGAAGAAGPSVAADIDLSTQEEITITEKQGTISTFTLDGTTIHKITIKEVDEVLGTVTITIESDPITVTLKIGETKEVDVDADGENDISVTLNNIVAGAADLTTKRLTPLPVTTPTEEVPPEEGPTEGPAVEEAPSKAWLWILIIVIIVVIGVGYWFMKKKK